MSRNSPPPFLVIAAAVLCVSAGSILVRLAEAPALTVAFYRIALASVILSPFAWRSSLACWPRLTRRQAAALVGAGVALGLHFGAWIASLSFTSVAASVLLVNTAPLFTLGFSRFFLGEGVRPLTLLAMAVAMAGAVLIAAGDWTGGAASLKGAALALAGALALSLYHVTGRGLRYALPLNAYVLAVWGGAALTLAAVAAVLQAPLLSFSARSFGFFLALAVIPTLGGHGLVNLALRLLPAPTVGLFLLGEPVGAGLLAYLVLGETPSRLTLAGGALVVAALVTTVVAERSPARVRASPSS